MGAGTSSHDDSVYVTARLRECRTAVENVVTASGRVFMHTRYSGKRGQESFKERSLQ